MTADRKATNGLPHIDGYTIESLIDTGGFSRVFRATQHGLDRSVAIKVLNASFEDERQQKTFERECRVMGQLSTHPNIVTVFASAQTRDGHPAIVMELYEGTYRADATFDIADVVDVGAKVADALEAIHERGIVHRDIKPHNVFVSSHGQPAIGDFGISSIESERTVTGGAGFSINYAPPEVFEEGGAGAAGDIYSLGATLYQLVTGEVPFPHHGDPADRMRSTVHKIITTPPPSIQRPDAPEGLDRLLRRCMAKQAADRPTSASAVAAELRRIQQIVGQPDTRQRIRSVHGAPGSPDAQLERHTSNVTVVRERERVAEPAGPTPVAGAERTPLAGRRKSVLGVAAGLTVIVASAAVIGLGLSGSGEGEAAATTIPAPTTAPTDRFEVLTPPEDLLVERSAEGTYVISWSESQANVQYQVLLVNSAENRFTDQTKFEWIVDGDTGSACFEVRTVNSDRTRVSQSAAGPACS